MSYNDFLSGFAQAQGVGSVAELLSSHAERYSFQITSRERAVEMIRMLDKDMGVKLKGKRVLDVGCAYGSHTIEMARAGAKVVGIDISNKWLSLAEINAKDDADVRFLNCDASTHSAYGQLKDDGPFDIFIVNDVFEHIYDTAGLLNNLAKLSAKGALLYFKIPNGLATKHVLVEGHKKVFGISLLAPDYWSEFVSAPFHIYYRRWTYFESLFKTFGFDKMSAIKRNGDENIELTRRHIINDLNRIRRHIKAENFDSPRQYSYIRSAAKYYYEEARHDLEEMAWSDLVSKYRTTFWEGVVRRI